MRYLLVPAAVACLVALGGCSGDFFMAVPDAVGLPGQASPMVVHLTRSEFGAIAPACGEAALTFKMGEGKTFAARADSSGYAVVPLPAPSEPGRYNISIEHVTHFGDVAKGKSTLYVLAPDKPITVVDLDSLPQAGLAAADAAAAIHRLEAKTQIIYATEAFSEKPEQARAILSAAKYPDAAIVPFRRASAWRPEAGNGTISALKGRLPQLTYGLAADDDGAKTLAASGLRVLYVSKTPPSRRVYGQFAFWKDLDLTAPQAAPASSQPAATSSPAAQK